MATYELTYKFVIESDSITGGPKDLSARQVNTLNNIAHEYVCESRDIEAVEIRFLSD